MELFSRAKAIGPELVEIRRDIHAHPELAFQEKRTSALVAERLQALGYRVRTGVGRTGVLACWISAARPWLSSPAA